MSRLFDVLREVLPRSRAYSFEAGGRQFPVAGVAGSGGDVRVAVRALEG
jgi:hypothetical protein